MHPYISGSSVVWVKDIYGGDFDTDMDTVYLYDIDSGLTLRISYPGAYDYIENLRVSGTNIAWGTGSGIMLAEKHCVTPLLADINNDCTVDIGDLHIMALQWLDFGTPLTAGCQ